MKTSRPFHVSTFGLSPDMKRVHPAFGNINRGDVSRHTLFEVLEIYRQLDTATTPSESHIAIHADTGRFVVRVVEKQLTLGPEGTPAAQLVPLAAEEIITRLGQQPDPIQVGPPPAPVEPRWRIALAVVLVVAGVGLTIAGLKPVLKPNRSSVAEDMRFVREPGFIAAQQKALSGLFATGQQSGDRRLTISPTGYIEFAELGPRQGIGSGTDTFEFARRGNELLLVTPRSGVIRVEDPNTLVYYGDTYRRLE